MLSSEKCLSKKLLSEKSRGAQFCNRNFFFKKTKLVLKFLQAHYLKYVMK